MAFSSSNSVCEKFRCSGSMGCRLFLTVITAALLLGCVPVRAQPSAVDQGVTLKKLVKDWGSPQFADWGANSDPCLGNWSHVTCDNVTMNRVLKLNFASSGLQGPIPASIGELVYLESLNLSTNYVSDPIPPEIGKLVNLQVLVLTTNNFTKPPPDDLLGCSNLTRLQMNKNQISGQLPAWIGKMVNLKYLDFNSNKMWGGLPPEYGDLVKLTHMQLWENTFSGTLPESWRNLKSISNFGMGHLYITGPIPEWLFLFPNLRVANFMRNQFIGTLPNLTRLMHNGISNFTTWDFSCNYLTGEYPTGYYEVLPIPNTTLQYFSNCYNNETDGSATINNNPNATQNTPMNCSRTFNCGDFMISKNNNGGCAPCPASQLLLNQTNCVCGKDLPPSSSDSKFPTGAVVGGVVAGTVFTTVSVALFFCLFMRKAPVKYPQFGRAYEGIDDPWTVPKELHRFTLQELEKATDSFSQEFFIGEGGFGKVYRGVLVDGKAVAIKCASHESAQGPAEFRNELAMLSRLHHRHLVGLEGFCDDDGLQVLVYEFMANGDLHDNLFGKGNTMSATHRLEVALGIARGLDYLHSFANPPVIHRDVKPSNVLLDDFMVAKLADFGIAKISPELYTHVSTRPLGTVGYMDPDYFRTNQLTLASDIFAFGVVLLEIVTGQRVFDTKRVDGINLNDWVRPRFAAGGVRAVVDERLGDDFDENLFTVLTEVGLSCSRSDRLDRPTMKEVLNTLEPFAAKAMKDSAQELRWSTSHFKNKSLFDETPFQPADAVPHGTPRSGDSSGTNSKPSTVPHDAFTALQPR